MAHPIPESFAAPGGEDPPEFAPYDAAFFVSGSGHVVSHDPHLNEDGEALYRFLLSQAATPPRMYLHCHGAHDESHSRLVPSQHGDRSDWRTEHYTERVVDFDFKIDLSQHIFPDPTHWSIGDAAPAYRGRMFRQVGVGGEKRTATRAELKAASAWDSERDSRGFPPWIGSDYAWREDRPQLMHDSSVLKSSWTLRQWADDYCSSKKIFKEFDYHKVVYGWNFDALKLATRSVISSTHYRGDIQVSFETLDSIISVRSNNRLSRALSSGWIKLLLIITFIYPFLWFFRRLHPRGGGIWRVCGGAYALKRVEKVSSSQEYAADGKTTGDPFSPADPPHQQASGTTCSPINVVGLREGVWFRQWEESIRRAVLNRVRDSNPLAPSDGLGFVSPAMTLDGYC